MEWSKSRRPRQSVLKLAALSTAVASVTAASRAVGAQEHTTSPLVGIGAGSSGITMAPTLARSGYAPVNGLNLYYEISGIGQPLILLHGGLGTIDTAFAQTAPALAQNRQVIAVELLPPIVTAFLDAPMPAAM